MGSELQRMLKPLGKVWLPSRQYFNLVEPESLRQKIRDYQPDLIVNAAAYTEVEQVDLNLDLAYNVNIESPRILAEEAHNLKIPLVHYSTDYVFDGTDTDGYKEDVVPNPLSRYAETKLKGEEEVVKVGGMYYVIRISRLFGSTGGLHGSAFSKFLNTANLARRPA